MAKSKAKNLKKKKKVSSYDDKLIKIIGASVVAVVAVLVAIICIVAYNGSYICKVKGQRVMDYEYKMFLGMVMEEWETKEEEKLEEDDEFDPKAFWTDAKVSEAKAEALDRACDWKSNYILAKKEGYGLNFFEKNDYYKEVDSNLQYTYYYFLQSYGMSTSSYSYEQFLDYWTNGMDLSEYRKYALQDKVISDYKNALMEGYTVSDDEIKTEFEKDHEDGDPYRKVVLNSYAITLPEIPDVPELPKDLEGKYDKLEDLDEKSETYVADLKAYVEKVEADVEGDVYVKDSDAKKAAKKYAESINDLIEAIETKEKIMTKMNGIYDQLAKNGKFTGEGFKEDKSTSSTTTSTAKPLATVTPNASATAPTDAPTEAPTAAAKDKETDSSDAPSERPTDAPSDSATAAPTAKPSDDKKEESKTKYKEYKDATLADLASKDGDLFTDTKGKYEFTEVEAKKDKDDLVIYDFAMSLVWGEDKKSIVSESDKYKVESVYDETKGYGEGKVKTKVVMISDEKYVYIVECVGIKDLETNAEPWTTGEKDKDGNPVKEESCVKDAVDAAIRDDKAEADLEQQRKDANYKISSKKEKNLEKIADGVVAGFKKATSKS